MQPFSKFTTPYFRYYQDLVEYNGAARDVTDPDPNDLNEIRIGFLRRSIAGANREEIRDLLASGKSVPGARFDFTGELRQSAR